MVFLVKSKIPGHLLKRLMISFFYVFLQIYLFVIVAIGVLITLTTKIGVKIEYLYSSELIYQLVMLTSKTITYSIVLVLTTQSLRRMRHLIQYIIKIQKVNCSESIFSPLTYLSARQIP